MADVGQLGAVVERFGTDNRRRRRIFMVAVPLGGLVACLGLLSLFWLEGPGGARVVPSVLAGFGLGAVGVGGWQGWLSFTRPDEVFTLYEGGLVHAYAEKSWSVSWDEIAKVVDQGRDNVFHRALGADIQYYLKLDPAVDGRRVMMITGLTRYADRLGEIVRQAAEDGTRPRPDTA